MFNYLLFTLERFAFYPQNSRKKDLITGIFHSLSWQQNDRIFSSFREDGHIRIVIASTALSMGVNFPDIRYIINWGPARTLIDQHQEAGRAGRDDKLSHGIVIYHGQHNYHAVKRMLLIL